MQNEDTNLTKNPDFVLLVAQFRVELLQQSTKQNLKQVADETVCSETVGTETNDRGGRNCIHLLRNVGTVYNKQNQILFTYLYYFILMQTCMI